MKGSNSFMFPPGVYYFGDPCYAEGDHNWSEWCDKVDGQFEIDGQLCGMFYTAYGDGRYPTSLLTTSDRPQDSVKELTKDLPVDSGTIGLVPHALAYGLDKYGDNPPWIKIQALSDLTLEYDGSSFCLSGADKFGRFEIVTFTGDNDDYYDYGDDDEQDD